MTQVKEASPQGRPITEDAELNSSPEQDSEQKSVEEQQNHTDVETNGKVSGVKKLKSRLERAKLEADFWRDEAIKLRKPAEASEENKTDENKPPVKPVRPKMTDFDDYGKYETALEKFEADRDKYHDENLSYQLRQKDIQARQQTEQQQIANSFAEQVAEAKKAHADFEDVAFSEDVPMSNAMMNAIVTSELGAEIAYELGKNPDEADRIARLSPIQAIREVGKIESRIASQKPAAEDEEEEKPAATTKAPAPPQPIRRTSSTVGGEPGPDRPYSEWLAWRNAELKKKRG